MIAIRYTLELLEPLLATALQSDPNSAVSYPFIPGSLIRGALIGKYLAKSNAKYFAVSKETRQRFFNGTTRYLNAYLLDNNNKRTLPTSLSWYKDKSAKLDDGYFIFDKSHRDFDTKDKDFEEIKQLKTHETKFCAVNDNPVILYEPARQINIHIRRENRSAGRATDDDLGAVFRYDALAARQLFGGVILCDTSADAKALFKDLNDAELIIGGSRSGGYGRVRVSNVEKVNNWNETSSNSNNISANENFTVTLLSDMILRDENGQFTDTLSCKTLANVLGIAEDVLTAGKTYRQTVMVGGFNRKWGLPLPQNLAIHAGSVFCFKSAVDIPSKTIETLLWTGIGERRTEGFGRVSINWIDSEKLNAQKPTRMNTLLKNPTTLDAESKKLAQQMITRLFRHNADRALVGKANYITITNSPKRSQLGGLRVEIRKAMQISDLKPVKKYLEEMKPTAKKQFEKARIRNEYLLNWLQNQLDNPNSIWQKLDNPNRSLKIGGQSVDLTDKLSVEYTLRFIDAVLAKASKEGRK